MLAWLSNGGLCEEGGAMDGTRRRLATLLVLGFAHRLLYPGPVFRHWGWDVLRSCSYRRRRFGVSERPGTALARGGNI